ncbi:MAG: protein BatD [Chitinophagaceae bacterium]|nr:protein BatD [Chitinophagaceae bacterium]
MLQHRLYRLLVAGFLLLSFTSAAQVKLSIIPSKTVVQQNESFQLQFVIEGASQVDDFIPPSFRNFEQLSGFEQTTGYTWVNGALSEYMTYSIILRPKIKGRLPIASAIVKAKGKTYTSSPISIFVKEAIATKQAEEERPDYYLMPGENVKEKIAKNLFIKATVDKRSCYVGEPVLATFKLFTRLDSESKVVKRPSLNGFSVVDMEEPEAGLFSKEMYNGKMYNCYLIRKVQLFPLQSGELVIEPVEVENLVRLIKANTRSSKETNTWLDAVMEKMKEADVTSGDVIEERIVLKSDSLKVKVLDLPEKNKPENFNGAVGSFSMEASLLEKSIAANDYATLRVVIKGKGNLPMITAPVVSWPSGVDSFDAKLNEQLDKHTAPISGTKTFDIPFAVSKAGSFTIPRINFTYFDEHTKTYHTITSDSMQLNVTAAVKRKVPVFKNEVVEAATPRWVWVSGVGGCLLMVIAGVLVFQHKRSQPKPQPPIVEQANEEDIQPQKTIQAYLQPAAYVLEGLHPKQFYSLLLQGVQDFLIERYQLESQNISNTQLAHVLQANHQPGLAETFQELAQACELAVFSPVQIADDRTQLFNKAKEFMQAVDNTEPAS